MDFQNVKRGLVCFTGGRWFSKCCSRTPESSENLAEFHKLKTIFVLIPDIICLSSMLTFALMVQNFAG